MNFSLKIFIVSISLYGCTPALICLTKSDQDLINVVTKNQGGGQGGNATISGPRDLNAIQKALDAGANVDTVFVDRNNETALHEAINVGDVKLVEFLLQHKANPNMQDADGNTPAHLAAREGNIALLDLLVKNGAKFDIKNKEGLTVAETLLRFGLSGGTGRNDVATLKKTLEKALELGADINKVFNSYNKFTVLHGIIHYVAASPAIVEFLLQHKANPNIQDADGNTPAHLAAREGNIALLDLLVKNGAKFDIKNKEGLTVAETLLRFGLSGGTGRNDVATLKKTLEKALELGADINKVFSSDNKFTVLHGIIHYVAASPAIVEFLLQHKANPNMQDADGNTPAHLAAQDGKVALLDLLVKNGAKLDIKNKAGKTVTDLNKNH